VLAGAPARVLLATPAWRGRDRLADLLRAWAVAFPANAPVGLYLLADPDVDGGPELWEAHVLRAAGEAGIDLGACADISVLDHSLHGRDAERIHRAVHGYVALHDACAGHLRTARRLDVRILEPNAISLIAWDAGHTHHVDEQASSPLAATGYGD
jgi:hypothetical protein